MYDVRVYTITFLILFLILGCKGVCQHLSEGTRLPPCDVVPVCRLEVLSDGRLTPVDTIKAELKFSGLSQN